MDDLKAKVAYIRGMTQGLEIGAESQEGRVLVQIVDVLEKITEDLSQMEVATEDLNELLEDIDEDLAKLEGIVYDTEDIICPKCGQVIACDTDFVGDEELDLTCPKCGEAVYEGDDWEYDDDNDTLESNK